MIDFEDTGSGRKRKVAVVAGVCALALVAGVAFAATRGGSTSGGAAGDTVTEGALLDTTAQTVSIDVNADDGWNSNSTPAIVHIKGTTYTGSSDTDEDIDFYHAVNASEDNKGSDSIELAPGIYTVETISPLNSDGSAYTIWNTGESKTIAVGTFEAEDGDESTVSATAAINPFVTVAYADEVKAETHYHFYNHCNDCGYTCEITDKASWYNHQDDTGHGRYTVREKECTENHAADSDEAKNAVDIVNNKVTVDMTKVPADQVTDDMVKDIVSKTETAIQNGDETLKGDNGTSVLNKLDENVKANPNVSDETKESSESAKENTDVNSEAKKTTGENTGKTDGSSSSSSNSGSSSSSSSNSGSSSNSSSSSSEHTHNWEAVYGTRQVEATYKTVHHDAVTHNEHTDAVTQTTFYNHCNDCGYTCEITDKASWYNHQDDTGHGRYTVRENTTVITPASDRTVVDQEAYDETVVDVPAHSESYITGYRCTSCGAKK